MKILVVGSGGREHALVWKLAQSEKVSKIYAAPGNPGMEESAERVSLKVTDIEGIAAFAEHEKIDLVVVGPEAPLALGLADRLSEKNILCFGPKAKGALLESSKKYAKDFMARHKIPTAGYRVFSSAAEAGRYLETVPDAPIVIKADGLAQGKGVVVASNPKDALLAVSEMMDGNRFGEAGRQIVVEEFLEGEEVSLMAFSDGHILLPMPPVQDHKRVGEGDTGPNTGGMGAYAPVAAFTPETAREVDTQILLPLQKALRDENFDYRGCFYIGLMLTRNGPKVIEFNARFGDPETQVLMPLLKSDLFDILYRCARGDLETEEPPVEWHDESAVCVVMASGGYPGAYTAGQVIEEDAPSEALMRNSWVFHAGTARNERGERVSAGGRVLAITAKGTTLEQALGKVYERVESVRFKGCAFRRDIAYRELARRASV